VPASLGASLSFLIACCMGRPWGMLANRTLCAVLAHAWAKKAQYPFVDTKADNSSLLASLTYRWWVARTCLLPSPVQVLCACVLLGAPARPRWAGMSRSATLRCSSTSRT
jgi:hypothetical protein